MCGLWRGLNNRVADTDYDKLTGVAPLLANAFFQNCSPLSDDFLDIGLGNVMVVVVSSSSTKLGFSLNELRNLLNRSDVMDRVLGLYVENGGVFSRTPFETPFVEMDVVRRGGLTDEAIEETPDDLLFGEIEDTELGELIPL